MAKPKTHFWTHERLKELDRLSESYSIRQLAAHFQKREEDIQQAFEFWQAHKRLKISSVQKRKVRITIYRAAYAEDSLNGRSYHDELTFL